METKLKRTGIMLLVCFTALLTGMIANILFNLTIKLFNIILN